MSDGIHQMSEGEFIQRYIQSAPHLMWFLGAGSSRSAGLPTATDIIWDLKRRYYCAHENQNLQSHDINNNAIRLKIQSYMDSKGFPKLISPEEYSFYFDLLFGTDYQAQQLYIQEVIASDKISLNIGHRAFAGLLEIGKARVVFTTNFDEVIERAFAEVTGKSLQPFHIEGSYAALDALNSEQFPIYAKVHGDFRYRSMKNLAKDLTINDEEIQKCLVAAATRFGIVVSGYSGRDSNVMTMFRTAVNQNNAFPHGLWWTAPTIAGINENVREFIAFARERGVAAHLVETGTFDEMLSRIWRQIPNKPKTLDAKVRTASVASVAIPLPQPGTQFPVLRTNALPIFSTPRCCGTAELEGSITFSELREKVTENRPNAILTYLDRVLFWGDNDQIAKLFSDDKLITIKSYDLDDGGTIVSESTFLKSFFEEAIATALCHEKPLFLRRKGRTYFAVVRDDKADESLFTRLRSVVGYKGNPENISGCVPELRDVTWAECVSIRLEIRERRLWLMLWPDIWIKPVARRKDASDFLRKRKLYRWNSQSYQLLDTWIELLLGQVGSGDVVKVACFPDSEYFAEFTIGTRTAFSRGGSNAG